MPLTLASSVVACRLLPVGCRVFAACLPPAGLGLSVARNDLGTVRPYASSRSVLSRPSWRVDDVALGQAKNRAASWVAWSMVAIFVIGCGIALTLAVGKGGFDQDTLTLYLAFTGFMVVGAVIVAHRPGNAIGRIFSAIGLLAATGGLAMEYAGYAYVTRPGSLPGAILAAWYQQQWWVPMIVLIFVATPLLFPTGRLLSPRWRPVAVVAGMTAATLMGLTAFQPTIQLQDQNYWVDNPIGLAGIPDPETSAVGGALVGLLGACMVAAVSSLVLRFRRSRGVERQQLKWVVYGGALLLVTIPVGEYLPATVGDALFGLIIAFVPVAAGIAILRYRLYDIDRLINRTLVYGLLTALLAGVYAGVVLVLGQVFGGVGGDPPSWAVAGATLSVAALFQPARRRVQAVVDRRFNRRKYDAARTLEAFSARLRDELDLDTLSSELLAVADQTMQPTTASLWLRPATQAQSRGR
jgi:hypothetical protein